MTREPLHETGGTCAVNSVHTSRRAPAVSGDGRRHEQNLGPHARACIAIRTGTSQRRRLHLTVGDASFSAAAPPCRPLDRRSAGPVTSYPGDRPTFSPSGCYGVSSLRTGNYAAGLAHPKGDAGGGFSHPGLAPIFGCGALLRISLGRELGGETAQDCAQPFGPSTPLGCGVRHAPNIGARDGRQAGEVYPKPGEVCRERG